MQEAPWEVVPVEPPPRASAESPPRTSAESPTPAPAPSRVLPPALPACGLGGAVILAVSQFLVLYRTHIAASAAPIASGTVGAGHGYALVPVAVLAALFAVGVRSAGSRPALLGLGLLGAVSLFIAIDRDGSQARREVLQRIGGHYVLTANQAAVGLYVETLGAVLLIATCACGLVLVGPARRNPTGQ